MNVASPHLICRLGLQLLEDLQGLLLGRQAAHLDGRSRAGRFEMLSTRRVGDGQGRIARRTWGVVRYAQRQDVEVQEKPNIADEMASGQSTGPQESGMNLPLCHMWLSDDPHKWQNVGGR